MNPNKMEKAAIALTRWIGSTQSMLVHTALFGVVIWMLIANVFSFSTLILIFNTAVSLEAIYLALFIQMTVNFQSRSLEAVEKDIDEMQEDVGEIQKDVEEISEDVDELQEDVEEMTEEEKEERVHVEHNKTLADIQEHLRKLVSDIERLQQK